MATATRTDVHRPSAINPTDYEYVAPELLKIDGMDAVAALRHYREIIRAHMAHTGGSYSTHEHGGNCMVCGNVLAVYTILFYHRPSNTYVRMGSDCANAVDNLSWSAADLRRLRREVRDAREHKAGLKKAEAMLSDLGLSAAWDVYRAGATSPWEEDTVRDIVSKLVRYGTLSDKAAAFLRDLLDRIDRREEIAAERAAEHAAAEPVPTGKRIEVEGEILSTRVDSTPYGDALKMLVRGDAGWKVWGTVPSGALDDGVELRNRRIRFRATVKASDDDEKFGFASRPHFLGWA